MKLRHVNTLRNELKTNYSTKVEITMNKQLMTTKRQSPVEINLTKQKYEFSRNLNNNRTILLSMVKNVPIALVNLKLSRRV